MDKKLESNTDHLGFFPCVVLLLILKWISLFCRHLLRTGTMIPPNELFFSFFLYTNGPTGKVIGPYYISNITLYLMQLNQNFRPRFAQGKCIVQC